jgi:hypothetical protein
MSDRCDFCGDPIEDGHTEAVCCLECGFCWCGQCLPGNQHAEDCSQYQDEEPDPTESAVAELVRSKSE